MKIHFVLLLCGSFYFTACNNPTAKEKENNVVIKDRPAYKEKGLEDLTGSKNMKEILCQAWANKADADDAKDVDITSGMEMVYRGYCFFNDGTVVKDPRGNVVFGKWILNEAVKPVTISMAFSNGDKEIRQLAQLMPNEMSLSTINGNEKIITAYTSEAMRHLNLKEDPFYPENMLWRIKPKSPETANAIKQRLKESIHFFVLFYQEKINAESAAVTFVGLPTCFTFYSGGASMQKEDELQKKWINCFYNKDQAMKAYMLAAQLIKAKYDLPKKQTNWLTANLSILKAMEKKIDSL